MSIAVKKKAGPEKAANENDPTYKVSGDATVQKAVEAFAPVIEIRAVRQLKPNPRNACKPPAKQIQQLQASVTTFGFTVAILVDEAAMMLTGHGRWEAARALGLSVVPTVAVKQLTEQLKRAFVIAENRLAQLSEWDDLILKEELQALVPRLPSTSKSPVSAPLTSTVWKNPLPRRPRSLHRWRWCRRSTAEPRW